MAAKEDVPPSPRPARVAPTAERLLRPHWGELTERLWANRVTGSLYEREIISAVDKEEVDLKADRSRSEGAVLLLEMMRTRGWTDAVGFAAILSRTEGIRDLGETLHGARSR